MAEPKRDELLAAPLEAFDILKRFGSHAQRRADAAPVDDEVQVSEERSLLAQQVAPKPVARRIDLAELEHVHARDRSEADRPWKAVLGYKMSDRSPTMDISGVAAQAVPEASRARSRRAPKSSLCRSHKPLQKKSDRRSFLLSMEDRICNNAHR
jgi:hypothetical protein